MGPAEHARGGRDRVGGLPDRVMRIAAMPRGQAFAVGLLTLGAFGQAVAQGAGLAARTPHAPQSGNAAEAALYAVPLCLLALAATAPLIFLRPGAAAVAITAANVLSLAAFAAPTVAALAAQVIASYRLGSAAEFGRGDAHRDVGPHGSVSRRGGYGSRLAVALRAADSPYAGIWLTVPFAVLALTSHESVAAVLLAALVPAAAGTGVALRARLEARDRTADRESLAETLTAHLARGERARIARELHDVVAHHISMISVQAETARLTTPGLPAAGTQRFAEIGDTARAGLTEMRRLLGVLREDAAAEVADRHPQPGLPQLAELIDAAREISGAGTRFIVSGPVTEFDPGVELAAYRIVQEALTNARRHAPGAAVDVELRYDGHDALRLRIRDNGPGPPPSADRPWHAAVGASAWERTADAMGHATDAASYATVTTEHGRPRAGGHGLLGMRERAVAVGGSLRMGTAPGGGFLIEAVLPAKLESAHWPEADQPESAPHGDRR